MDEIIKGGVWIPVVRVCRHERSREFKLMRYGAKEDSGMSFGVGNLISVSSEVMMREGLKLVLEGLEFYRVWPAKTKLECEIGVMDSRKLSKFVRDHQWVSVLKRDTSSILVRPDHRVGRGYRGVTGYMRDEIRVPLPANQEQFYQVLMQAFDLAT